MNHRNTSYNFYCKMDINSPREPQTFLSHQQNPYYTQEWETQTEYYQSFQQGDI